MTTKAAAAAPSRTAGAPPPLVVGDVMTRAVVAAYPGAAEHDIAMMLCSHGIGAVPVIDEDRRVVGVVTAADLLAPLPPQLPRETRRVVSAYELMSSPAITITVHAPLVDAGERMTQHRVHSLPVVIRDGELVGMVARSDIVRAFVAMDVAGHVS